VIELGDGLLVLPGVMSIDEPACHSLMLPGELQGAIEDALRSCWEDSGDAKVRVVWEGKDLAPKPGVELAILGVTR